MPDSLRRQIVAVLGVAVLVVVAIGGVAYRVASDLVHAANRAERGHLVQRQVDALVERLDAAEASRHTPVVRGAAPVLAPDPAARRDVDATLATLHGLVASASPQAQLLGALDSAAHRRLTTIDQLTPPPVPRPHRASQSARTVTVAGMTSVSRERDELRALARRLQRQEDGQARALAQRDAQAGDRAQRLLIGLLLLSLAGGAIATWLLLRSVAARARLADELRAERERLSAILTQMPTGLAVADAGTRQVVFGNTQLAEIWRRPFTAPLGTGDTALAAWLGAPLGTPSGPSSGASAGLAIDGGDDSPVRVPLSRVLNDGDVVRGVELLLTRSDGSAGMQRVHAAPVRDEAGRIIAGVIMVEDVTVAHEAAQAAARTTQRLARLQRLTERVSTAVTTDDVVRVVSEDVAATVAADSAVLFVDRLTDGRLEPMHDHVIHGRGPIDAPSDDRPPSELSASELEALATQAAHSGQLVVRSTHDAMIAALPLGAGQGARGALTLEFRPARPLADDERHLLLAAGRIAAQGMTRARLQSLREEERRRLARELHDEFGQALTGLKLDLAWLLRQLATPAPELADAVRGMSSRVDDTVEAMRRVAAQLRPGVLDDLGLAAALEWQASDFERRSGVRCEMTVQLDDATIDEPYATAVFRVFQEALTNVARHARAQRVCATLAMHDGALTLRVHDDGVGIAASTPHHGLGLAGMRERAAALSGTVRVRPAAGGGTEVVLTLPYEARAALGAASDTVPNAAPHAILGARR